MRPYTPPDQQMNNRQEIIDRIFAARNRDGFWKMLSPSDKYYPACLHYVPVYRASLWTLLLLADLGLDPGDPRAVKPLRVLQNHFFDPVHGIFSLKEDHFPIPCLNGNMIFLDGYFNGTPGEMSRSALAFFGRHQRFDDGEYAEPVHAYCSNKSCYGRHSCYWGVAKLLKSISFIPPGDRTAAIVALRDRCIRYILLHKVCFSSRREGRILARGIDRLTFPNMYKSDFLELLWLLKREGVHSAGLLPALHLLASKRQDGGHWHLERKMHNMVVPIGEVDRPNPFITARAGEVLGYYADLVK
jgi:hypothetical protein